jgi:hypothetical protein
MAVTFKSSEITAVDTNGGLALGPNEGRVKTAEFNYTTVGTEVITDGIELVQLPAEAEVVGYLITDAGSGFSDADLGTTFGGAEIATGLAITAATVTSLVAPVEVGTTGKVYLNLDAGTVSAAKLITGIILYI